MRPISGLLRRDRTEPGLASRSLLSNAVYLDDGDIDINVLVKDLVDVSSDKYESLAISRGVGVSDSCALLSISPEAGVPERLDSSSAS